MAKGWGAARIIAFVAALLLALLATSGCAGSIRAQTAKSLVRARPTTPPETYALQLSGSVAALHDALDGLAALIANPHYLDDQWKSNAVNLATLVELGYRQLEALSPPDEQQANYAEVVRAIQGCQTLTVYVFQGVNNVDKGPFDEVRQRVDACRSQLGAITGARAATIEQPQPVSTVAPSAEVHAQLKRDANLRNGPSTNYPVVGVARQGDKFTVIGQTAKGDWLQVNGDEARAWWIAVFLVQADGDLQTVPVVTPVAPPLEPSNVIIWTPTPGP